MAPRVPISTLLVRRRASIRRATRAQILLQLYSRTSTSGVPPSRGGAATTTQPDALLQLANTFTRYAQTQSTAYETGAAKTSSGGGAGTVLERQVERAFSQVLGRGAGKDGASFATALNGAFPLTADGQVQVVPARSAVSMYGPSTDGTSQSLVKAGLAGQLSAEQATLYRQATTISADALGTLAGLMPFVPEAEVDKVEALRALVRAEFSTLVEEFGRINEPRSDRVKRYFDALVGPNGHLIQFGRHAFLDGTTVTPTTSNDEAMLAGFELVKRYVSMLQDAFNAFANRAQTVSFPVFTLRLQRAQTMLAVIGEGNDNFMSAMDSVGFTDAERRSQSARFTLLQSNPVIASNLQLPDITVADFTDEVDQLTSTDGPAYLADSGQFGLDLVTDQADRLFRLLAPVLANVKSGGVADLNSLPTLGQVLTHERVSWALDDLVQQFSSLADLAA